MPNPTTLETEKQQLARAANTPVFLTANMPASLATTVRHGFAGAEFWPIQVIAAQWLVMGPGPTAADIVVSGFLNGVAAPGTVVTIPAATAADATARLDPPGFEPFELAPGDVFRWDVLGDVLNTDVWLALTLTARTCPVLR
jgi:hypothetical protein